MAYTGWEPDPTGRNQLRYWDGSAWTSDVSNDGVASVDAFDDKKWWGDGRCLINGVFKGGGAKGVAYAGALNVVAEAGMWFKAVAGASAGAITATLIAAGLNPARHEFEREIPRAVSAVKRRPLRYILGHRDAVLDSEPLYEWLDQLLRQRVRQPGDLRVGPVTFSELNDGNGGLELYVVALDLERRSPVVFHHLLTPDVAVAASVMASSAIPGALPSGRLVVDVDGALEAHQLVDGGAWANFPIFVFKDRLFRSWLAARVPGARDRNTSDDTDVIGREDGVTTLGFLLDNRIPIGTNSRVSLTYPPDRRVSTFVRGTSRTSGQTVLYTLDLLLGSNLGRLTASSALSALVGIMMLSLPRTVRAVGAASHGAPWMLGSMAAFMAAAVVVSGLMIAIVVILFVGLSRAVTKTVVPAASAALSAVTGEPPWVMERTDRFAAVVVRHGRLKTLGFRADSSAHQEAVRLAACSTREQLSVLQHSHSSWFAGSRSLEPETAPESLPSTPASTTVRAALAPVPLWIVPGTTLLMAFLILIEGTPGQAATQRAIAGTACVAATVASSWPLLRRAAGIARSQAASEASFPRRRARGLWVLAALLLVGGVADGLRVQRIDRELTASVVVGAIADDEGDRYSLRLLDGSSDQIDITDEASHGPFELGERVMLFREEDESWDVFAGGAQFELLIPALMLLGSVAAGVGARRELRRVEVARSLSSFRAGHHS